MSVDFKNITVNIVVVILFGLALVGGTASGVKIVNDLSQSIKNNKIYIDRQFAIMVTSIDKLVRSQEITARKIADVQKEARTARKEANQDRYFKQDAERDKELRRMEAELRCLRDALLNAHMNWKCHNPNATPVPVYTANYGNWWAGMRVEKAK